ncbi:hypothetical protein NARC_210052 [Candidatus Nitrosocosmicus arcticus]|uniref:Uncharacterized protein n=1 Tax=Candidatus Nitrosocosmicus arcticus TaxID=2035267 RepID=A0A557SR87_9ARCH|nr:hypothetical protein NARC_210052 [Candidatus Nitrosocosmicus arcticus]
MHWILIIIKPFAIHWNNQISTVLRKYLDGLTNNLTKNLRLPGIYRLFVFLVQCIKDLYGYGIYNRVEHFFGH